jgi:hypothetical protein
MRNLVSLLERRTYEARVFENRENIWAYEEVRRGGEIA